MTTATTQAPTFRTSPKYPGWTIQKVGHGEWDMGHPDTLAFVKVQELVGGFAAYVCRWVPHPKKPGEMKLTTRRVWGAGGAHVAQACKEAIW